MQAIRELQGPEGIEMIPRFILVVPLALAGCSTPSVDLTAVADPPAPPAPVMVDTFCQTARKRTWSLKDTPETIREARAWNTLVDRRCGVPEA